VQLARSGGQWRVVAAAARTLPADLPAEGQERAKAQVLALRDLLDSSSFSGRRAVSGLPASLVQYKNLRLPPMPPTELRTAVEWEASDRLKLGQNYQIQFFDAGEVRQGEEHRQEIILMAAGCDAVERHVEVLTECGLTPEAIDAAPAAMARWAACGAAEESQLVVDIGAAGAGVLICRAGRVGFFKRLELGGRQMEEAIARLMNTSATEAGRILQMRAAGTVADDSALVGSVRREGASQAINDAIRPIVTDLAREVGLCLRYHAVTFRGSRPQLCVLAGGCAGDPLLPQVLAQEAGVSLVPASAPFDWSRVSESMISQFPAPSWAVALGLALRHERAALKGAA
jgi:type IV pilus assembly protein PilM